MPAGKRKAGRRVARLDRAARKTREAAIIADIKAGQLSYRMIAHKHGVSLPTVNAKARKAGIRRPRGRRPAAATAVAPIIARARPRVRRGRPAGKPAIGSRGFQEAFRQMVLQYFPTITLAKFDRLAKLVERAVS